MATPVKLEFYVEDGWLLGPGINIRIKDVSAVLIERKIEPRIVFHIAKSKHRIELTTKTDGCMAGCDTTSILLRGIGLADCDRIAALCRKSLSC